MDSSNLQENIIIVTIIACSCLLLGFLLGILISYVCQGFVPKKRVIRRPLPPHQHLERPYRSSLDYYEQIPETRPPVENYESIEAPVIDPPPPTAEVKQIFKNEKRNEVAHILDSQLKKKISISK